VIADATVVISRKGKIMNYWQGEVSAGDLEAALTRARGTH
jgi:hypothetical protein